MRKISSSRVPDGRSQKAMRDLFNPAQLQMLEDRRGAIAYGFVAPRVMYGRFAGALSANLACDYAARVMALISGAPKIAYYADFTALTAYEPRARVGFSRFVQAQRDKLASIALLGDRRRASRFARALVEHRPEPSLLCDDPLEFERLLSNVAPAPWQLSLLESP